MSVVTLLPLYWRRHGLEDSEIGWMASGFSIAAIVARYHLGGWLEDRGRRPFLYLGSLLLTMMPLSFPFLAMDFLPWFCLRLMQGAGYAFYITAILTWVADRSPPDRIAQGQGVFGVSGLLGSAVGPMTSEAIYKLYGFTTMFKAIGTAGLVAVVLAATLPESRPDRVGPRIEPVPIRLRDFRAMLWVTIPFGWVVGTVITFIAPYGDDVRLPSVALYFVGFALASISVRLGSGGFIDKVRPARLVQVSGSLLALSALTLACLDSYPFTAVLFSAAILNGIGHGFLFPGLSAYTVRRATLAQRGGAIALYTGVFDSGVLLGSVVSGYFCQLIGYPSAYALAGLLLLGALPVFSTLDHTVEPIEPELLHVDPSLL
jgi:predicted MFS family arabinose efflux permease